ncbi:MAG: transcriptional regulator NrdR [Clostridia bacterium]|nr:transcriptional regulator NrdR [Clostridia bacterium]
MKCIYCGHNDSKVVDSRSSADSNQIRRRRECLGCGKRFTTYETVELTPILVVKTNKTIEPFNKEKIELGIIKACEKRPVSVAQIEQMTADIEKQIQNSLNKEITSKEIGEMVMNKLREVDQVAYVRFASVYRQFEDITHFKKLFDEL